MFNSEDGNIMRGYNLEDGGDDGVTIEFVASLAAPVSCLTRDDSLQIECVCVQLNPYANESDDSISITPNYN